MNKMNQVQINGIWWDVENTIINGEKLVDFDTANAYAKSLGKRLPTKEEWRALVDSGYEFDKENNGIWFANRKLFLLVEGWKYSLSGKIYPGVGAYWSSSASTVTHAWGLLFVGSAAYLGSDYRADGYSIRCVSGQQNNWWRKFKQWIMCKIYK